MKCNTVCCGLGEILVYGMLGGFQSPGRPRNLVKMVQVEHEVYFCKATSPAAPVHLCLPPGTVILSGEKENEFAVADLCNAILHSHTLHKAMGKPTVSPQMSFVQGVVLKCHFHALAVAKRAKFVSKPFLL